MDGGVTNEPRLYGLRLTALAYRTVRSSSEFPARNTLLHHSAPAKGCTVEAWRVKIATGLRRHRKPSGLKFTVVEPGRRWCLHRYGSYQYHYSLEPYEPRT